MSHSPDGGGSHPSLSKMAGGGRQPDYCSSRAFPVTKHSTWKGKYKRIALLSPEGLSTLNPGSMECTNGWNYSDVVSVGPMSIVPHPPEAAAAGSPAHASHSVTAGGAAPSGDKASALQFQVAVRKGGGKDTMKFSSEFRTLILTEAFDHFEQFAERPIMNPRVKTF